MCDDVTEENRMAAPPGRWISVRNRDGGRGDPALRFAEQAEKQLRKRGIHWGAKTQGHYDEASGTNPEMTSETTLFPVKDKRRGRA